MDTMQSLLQSGKLTEAIAAGTDHLKRKPADLDGRLFYTELLCLAGDIERADRQLDTIAKLDVSALPGVTGLRRLIRGEQARLEVHREGRVPELVDDPDPMTRAALETLVLLRAGDSAGAASAAQTMESARGVVSGQCNGKAFSDIRDIDDITAGVLEVITAGGDLFWIPISRVRSLIFEAPSTPRDLLWRKAQISVRDGPEGEVFLPAIYVAPTEPVDDGARLGRSTAWVGDGGEAIRGIGQRCFLIDDDDVPMLQIQSLEIDVA